MPGKRMKIPDNIYTVMLALACCAVLATAVFVLIQCYRQYGTIFSAP
jgi:hypothetical protein